MKNILYTIILTFLFSSCWALPACPVTELTKDWDNCLGLAWWSKSKSGSGYYVGEFRKGYRHGIGIYYHNNGQKYDGEWEGNYSHGKGTHYWPDGEKYIGNSKMGRFHGEGIRVYPDGRVQEGIWENNKFLYANKIGSLPVPSLDSDVIAKQKRLAAEIENDSVKKEKLWREYIKYQTDSLENLSKPKADYQKEIKFSLEDDRVNLYQHDAISFGLFEIMADSFKDALQDQTRYYFETKDTKMSYPGPFVRFDFKAVSIDLNDDGIEEVIAYMFGPDHCGSGGCVSYILQNMEVSERDYDGTEVIAEDWKIIGSPFPGDIIFISSNKTNGYFDISHSSGWDEKYSCKFKNGRYVRDSNPKVQC